jgi:hypothetical protein
VRQRKKQEKAKEGLLDWLKNAGVDTSTLATLETTAVPERTFQKSLEAEGILLTLQSARLPVKAKKCKRVECEQVFATNYAYVGYCSDSCRAKDIERLTGIRWDPTKKMEQRWGTEENPSQLPIVISPQAIQMLKSLYQQILALEENQDQPTPIQKLTQIQERSYQIHNLAVREHYLKMESQEHANGQKVEQEELVENTNQKSSPQPSILDELFGGSSAFQSG